MKQQQLPSVGLDFSWITSKQLAPNPIGTREGSGPSSPTLGGCDVDHGGGWRRMDLSHPDHASGAPSTTQIAELIQSSQDLNSVRHTYLSAEQSARMIQAGSGTSSAVQVDNAGLSGASKRLHSSHATASWARSTLMQGCHNIGPLLTPQAMSTGSSRFSDQQTRTYLDGCGEGDMDPYAYKPSNLALQSQLPCPSVTDRRFTLGGHSCSDAHDSQVSGNQSIASNDKEITEDSARQTWQSRVDIYSCPGSFATGEGLSESRKQVVRWLHDLEPEVEKPVLIRFVEEGIDIEALALLDDHDLIGLGLHKLGWRRKLMEMAKRYQESTGSKSCLEKDISINPQSVNERRMPPSVRDSKRKCTSGVIERNVEAKSANYYSNVTFKVPLWLKLLAPEDSGWFKEGFVCSFIDNYQQKSFVLGSELKMENGKPKGSGETFLDAGDENALLTKISWLHDTAVSEFYSYVLAKSRKKEGRFGVKLMLGETAVGSVLLDVLHQPEIQDSFSITGPAYSSPVLYISQIFILPQFQRRGFATWLHLSVCKSVKHDFAVTRVEALGRIINDAAKNLFSKVGLKILPKKEAAPLMLKYAYSPDRYFAAVKEL